MKRRRELHVQAVEMVPVTFVFCPRCGKRVEIGRVPVGAEVDCAGCGRKFALAVQVLSRGGAGQGEDGLPRPGRV